MRATTLVILGLITSTAASVELRNIQVGGSLRIRGTYYNAPVLADSANTISPGFRYPATIGRLPVTSIFSWDHNRSHGWKFVEQRTRLSVKADFTDNVTAFAELENFGYWGESFRSNYITGMDNRPMGTDDAALYQSYIEVENLWGWPLNLRIGRQEFILGSGFLIGNNDGKALFTGLSFDGINLVYTGDTLSLGAFAAKLGENGPIEEDGDTDIYVLYSTYTGIEDATLEAYWIWLRDPRALEDTNTGWLASRIEHAVGVDDYDVTNLHTAGIRAAGKLGPFDYHGEIAYQFGNAGQVGKAWALGGSPVSVSPYGDSHARWDNWGGLFEVGYAYQQKYTPRLFIGGGCFGGGDDNPIPFLKWLDAAVNPFYRPSVNTHFNRLFSNYECSIAFDGTDLTNCWFGRAGASASPVEKIKILLYLQYTEALQAYHAVVPGNRWFISPLSFWTHTHPRDLGWETFLDLTYAYSEDLSVELAWGHLWTGGGMAEGNFVVANGLGFSGGTARDPADWIYAETKIAF